MEVFSLFLLRFNLISQTLLLCIFLLFSSMVFKSFFYFQQTDPEGDTAVNTSNVSNVSEDGVIVTEGEHDPYFEPVVTLPEVQVKTNEEEEEEMVKL